MRVTASFASASQIGAMLGGEKFQAVSYIGESRAVYISPVDASLILIQIFQEDFLTVLKITIVC